jgi:hypothetical protein
MTAWLKDYVNGLTIAPEGRLRMDCPACGKKNTFSVSDTNGERLWFCFHADCGVRGRTGFRIRNDTPYHPLLKKTMTVREPLCEQEFQLPDTVVPVSRSEEAVRYLKRVNAYDAYLSGRVDIRYDFRMNRVVYLIKDRRRTVDAAGRSLVNAKPKWWRYGKSGNPFVCGSSRIGVVLEDCASACSVSSFLSGIALLGTNLQDSHLPTLRQYDRLLVALDKDATKKALELVRRLQAIRPTNLIVLNKDVKDMTNDERHSTFEKYIN